MTVIIFNDNIIAIEADDAVASIDFGDGIQRLNNTITTNKVSLQSIEVKVYYTTPGVYRKFGAYIAQSFDPGTTVTITGRRYPPFQCVIIRLTAARWRN